MEGSRSPRQPPQHQADHGHLDERLAALHLPLVVLAQTAVTYQPRKSSLHYPPLRQNLETLGLLSFREWKALGSSVNRVRSRSYKGGYAPVGPGPIGPGLGGFPGISLPGSSVNRGQPVSLLDLLNLLALEGFNQCR